VNDEIDAVYHAKYDRYSARRSTRSCTTAPEHRIPGRFATGSRSTAPAAKREFGYFVLPILQRDWLVGRIDPLFHGKAGVLRVPQVYAEEGATEAAGEAVAKAIDELTRWLGASDVDYGRVPHVWRRDLG